MAITISTDDPRFNNHIPPTMTNHDKVTYMYMAQGDDWSTGSALTLTGYTESSWNNISVTEWTGLTYVANNDRTANGLFMHLLADWSGSTTADSSYYLKVYMRRGFGTAGTGISTEVFSCCPAKHTGANNVTMDVSSGLIWVPCEADGQFDFYWVSSGWSMAGSIVIRCQLVGYTTF